MPSETFNDFSGGWSGTLDLAKVPRNMWDGRNVIIYRDGSIGPRPGLKAWDIGRTISDKVWGVVFTGSGSAFAQMIFYIDGNTVYGTHENQDGVDEGSFGTLSDTPTFRINMVSPIDNVMLIPDTNQAGPNDFYFQKGEANIVNMNQDGGPAATIYGVRVIRGQISTAAEARIFYSDPADETSWPALNFIELPALLTIVAFMAPVKNGLILVTTNNQWFLLTGVPGVNDVLRKLPVPRGRMGSPLFSYIQDNDDTIFYLSSDSNSVASFDGSVHRAFSYLTMTPEDPQQFYHLDVDFPDTIVTSVNGAEHSPGFIIANGPLLGGFVNRLLLRHNGAWALHDFDKTLTEMWSYNYQGRLFGFALDESDNDDPVCLDFNLNRPAFTSDTHAQPGDLTTTPLEAEFTLPETWSPDSDFLRVNEVVLEVKKFDTGAPVDNRVQVTVESLARGLNDSVADGTQTKTWTEAGSSGADDFIGTPDRIRFTFGEQGAGGGYRVRVHGLRGVAVRSITVNSKPEQGNQRVY